VGEPLDLAVEFQGDNKVTTQGTKTEQTAVAVV
jgi:hypothetical protein